MTPEEKIENIIAIRNNIPMHKISILVGPNGYGKSFLRKVLWQRVEKEINDGRNPAKYIADISMERRTDTHSELGGLGVFFARRWLESYFCADDNICKQSYEM